MTLRALISGIALAISAPITAHGQFESLIGTHWINPGDKRLTQEELIEACKTPTLTLVMDDANNTLLWQEKGKSNTQAAILSKEVNSLRLVYPIKGGGLPSGDYMLIMMSPTAFLHVEQVSRKDVTKADPYIDRPSGRQFKESFTTEATPWLLCNGLMPPQNL